MNYNKLVNYFSHLAAIMVVYVYDLRAPFLKKNKKN